MKIKPSRLREIIQEEVSDFNSKMSAPPDDITGEPDDEGAMARSQLLKLAKYSAALMDMMNDDTQLPAWVQAKITKSASYLGAVKHFIEGELELNEDKQQMKISKQKLERIIKQEVLKEMGMQMGEDEDGDFSDPELSQKYTEMAYKELGELKAQVEEVSGGTRIDGPEVLLNALKSALEKEGYDDNNAVIKSHPTLTDGKPTLYLDFDEGQF